MDRGSMIRTVILVLALVNQVLVTLGYSPLPIDDAQVELLISTVFTVVISTIAWWRNNYISKRGLAQKEVLKEKGLTK